MADQLTHAVLVLNAGSSSIKAALIGQDAHGQSRRLWQDQRPWAAAGQGPAANGLNQVIGACLDPWLAKALQPWHGQLGLVAHRVVHGGARYTAPTRLTPEVMAGIRHTQELAPLHNGVALAVIHWMAHWLPSWHSELEQWACFDTAFHHTLPEAASTYAIPEPWRRQGLRRFGFHGLNHQHVSETVAGILHEEGGSAEQAQRLRLISCHLGAGSSLCAIAGGRSVATTMGFTPLEGLVMATRSGSVDPGLLLHLLLETGLSPQELSDGLNHQGGLLGLSGLSGDMRQLRQAADQGHAGAQLALEVFTQKLLEGIGAMASALRGVDVIALSGGIGQHDEQLAHTLMQELAWLGPFRLLQIPADEEGQIAQQCLAANHGQTNLAPS